MHIKDWITLILLAAVWGSAFMFIKIAAPDLGPVMLVTVRLYLAGLLFLPFLLQKKYLKLFKSHFNSIFILAIMNNALPFTMFAYASLGANSNMLAILNGTTALITTVLAYFWLKNKVSYLQAAGLLLGFLGILVLVNPANASTTFVSSIACLVGAFCYSFCGCYIQRYASNLNAFVMIGWSMFFGALLITPFAFFNVPNSFPKTETILSLLWLGIISTGVAYLGYVRLIERIGAVRTSTVTYLIPAFGILWGSIFLDEQITLIISIGFILILLGIYFSNSSAKEN